MLEIQLKMQTVLSFSKLKADRPHLRDYPHRPTDYRNTDKHLRLVMTPMLFAALCKAEPLISTAAHQKFDLDL